MSTLTDRYVWGVLRAVPETQRRDLEPEIRALVADAVEARVAAGTVAAEAERAALVELGDPEHLAARYTDRRLYLLGPGHFVEWRRLLTLLLPIVVPITAIAVAGAGHLGGRAVPELVLDALGTALMVGIQLTFWITVVFVLLERSGQPPLGEAWTPERLPERPAGRKGTRTAEVVVAAIAIVVGAVLIAWQQAAQPIRVEGVGYPLFDPALWSFWLPYFLVLLGVELVALVWRWRTDGWTWPQAVLNLATNVAFAVPALWLLTNGNLFHPGLEQAVADLGITSALQPAGAVVVVVVAASAAWDAFDGFRQAWLRGREAAGA
jgi:hypothetical protein